MATLTASVSFKDIGGTFPDVGDGSFGLPPEVAGFGHREYLASSTSIFNQGNYYGPFDLISYQEFLPLFHGEGTEDEIQRTLNNGSLLFAVTPEPGKIYDIAGNLAVELGYSDSSIDYANIADLNTNLATFGGRFTFDRITFRETSQEIVLQISDFLLPIDLGEGDITLPIDQLKLSEIFDGDDVVTLSNLDDTFVGYDGDDVIWANGGNDDIYGDDGNDTIYAEENEAITGATQGWDVFRGGAGYDFVVYENVTGNISVTRYSDNIHIKYGGFSDYLYEVEEIKIGPVAIVTSELVLNEQHLFDSSSLSSGPLYSINVDILDVARTYQAAFGRIPDFEGMNFWIDHVESGVSVSDISEQFIRSPEFTDLYGAIDSLTDARFIELLYQNVLGREPDEAGYNYWVNALGNLRLARQDTLASFARSDENVANTQYLNSLNENDDGFWVF